MSDIQSNIRFLAVIGTAGRDKTIIMPPEIWEAMRADLLSRLNPTDHLVSGGAAWADHLAVQAYLDGQCDALSLFLPAPLVNGVYVGPLRSAGASANYYHSKFSSTIGVSTLRQVQQAIEKGARVTTEPAGPGFSAMFARNRKVAQLSNAVVAYTYGKGEEPLPGGTYDTWSKIRSVDKVHVGISTLQSQINAEKALEGPFDEVPRRPRFSY